MKLSSGIAKIPQMLELGVPVGLAVDGSAAMTAPTAGGNARGLLLHRLNSSNQAPRRYDILKMATAGSASLLGREKLGRIAPGMAADFFLVDLNRLELVGAQFDVTSMLCTVGLKSSVDYTVANGNVVVKEGKLTGIDEEKVTEEANALVTDYLNQP